MRTLTIHALEPAIEKRVRAKARREGKSINQALKELLATSVGIASPRAVDHRADFAEFNGIWTKGEGDSFEAAVADLKKVDLTDWK